MNADTDPLPEARSGATSRVTFFDRPTKPNGGGTVYVSPDSGNPYARIDEAEAARPVVVVDLPCLEGEL